MWDEIKEIGADTQRTKQNVRWMAIKRCIGVVAAHGASLTAKHLKKATQLHYLLKTGCFMCSDEWHTSLQGGHNAWVIKLR